MEQKIFVLGDSRTGTTTLHKFLKFAGFKSIHYFFEESSVSKPAHLEFDSNWLKLKKFIDESDFDAFSDYPLRSFYKQLFTAYPDAIFILTVRKDVETWRKSMNSFFAKFNVDIDLENLTQAYVKINQEIRDLAEVNGSKFCEICIDDDASENGEKVSNLIGLAPAVSLGWENRTDAYDNSLWSTRVTFFNTRAENVLSYVKRVTYPAKAMMSESGWAFLINDSSNFLDYLYGDEKWTDNEFNRARNTLEERSAILEDRGVLYHKFVIPEKSVVYSDYMPKVFSSLSISDERPAARLSRAEMPFFHYFDSLLKDARSFGNVYFRGDSHTNWYGAFFLYQSIINIINRKFDAVSRVKVLAPFSLHQFKPFLAAYGGDIFVQLDNETRNVFSAGAWKKIGLGKNLEHLVGYELPLEVRCAKRVEVDRDYLENLGERETFKFSHPDKSLPKAVIFRDSTADYLVDLLAEHFSESLFIWHKGAVYGDVIDREKPDVVIHLMAERFILQYSKTNPMQTLFA